MVEIPKDTLDKIHSLAKQLGDAIDEAGLRLLAKNGSSCDWSAFLMVVPCEVEMSDFPGTDEEGNEYEELEPPEEWSLAGEIDCTVYSTEINSLYKPGESARNYF